MEKYDVRLLAAALVASDLELVNQLFEEANSPPPTVLWDAMDIVLEEEDLVAVRDFWRALPRWRGGLPRAETLPISHLPNLSRFIMLVEPVDQCMDVIYRHYGRGIAESFGRDMTGERGSAFGGMISRFFTACYRASMLLREPIYTEHIPPPDVSVSRWRRLILPLTDDHGEVSLFLAGNIPGPKRNSTAAAH